MKHCVYMHLMRLLGTMLISSFVLIATGLYDGLVAYVLSFTSVSCSTARKPLNTLIEEAQEEASTMTYTSWQERVSMVYGALWSRHENDNTGSRCAMAWWALMICSIRIMAAIDARLLPAVVQTFIVQLLWLGTESYCGIMVPRAALMCACPHIFFMFVLMICLLCNS